MITEKSEAAKIFGTEQAACDFIRQLPPEDVVGIMLLPDPLKPTTWIVRYREMRG